MAANDTQMQVYCDTRIRPRAQQIRALIAALRDDKAALDEVYDRAANGAPWADARTDGPPNLLTQQDVLVYNTIATQLLACIDGTANAGAVTELHANLPVFLSACVHAL